MADPEPPSENQEKPMQHVAKPVAPTTPATPAQENRGDTKAKDHRRVVIALWVSIVSCVFSALTAFNNCRSANASTRSADAATHSADAAALSARAAVTNAEWASYQMNPHHDLVARVLSAGGEFTSNGIASAELALVNNGNQTEIVRSVIFYCSVPHEPEVAESSQSFTLNKQIAKGDKQVLHFDLSPELFPFQRGTFQLQVGIVAIAPDSTDIESKAKIGIIETSGGSRHGMLCQVPGPFESIKVLCDEGLPDH